MFADRQVTPEGFERHIRDDGRRAVRALSPGFCSSAAKPRPAGRQRHLGRDVHAGRRLDDLGIRGGDYSGPRAYASVKRVQVAMTREWARRYATGRRVVLGDASGLGRHSRPRGVTAGFPRSSALVAHAGAGGRHDHVAGGGARSRAATGTALPRSPAPPVRPRAGNRLNVAERSACGISWSRSPAWPIRRPRSIERGSGSQKIDVVRARAASLA